MGTTLVRTLALRLRQFATRLQYAIVLGLMSVVPWSALGQAGQLRRRAMPFNLAV